MDLVVHGGAVPTFLLERLLAATGARPAIRARAPEFDTFPRSSPDFVSLYLKKQSVTLGVDFSL